MPNCAHRNDLIGISFSTDSNPCNPNPCHHGTCTPTGYGDDYTCTCHNGYSGSICAGNTYDNYVEELCYFLYMF